MQDAMTTAPHPAAPRRYHFHDFSILLNIHFRQFNSLQLHYIPKHAQIIIIGSFHSTRMLRCLLSTAFKNNIQSG
jgi:hypothetical protein